MKSIYKIIFSSLILMGLMTSCFDKFLEEDVYDFLSPNNFYKTEADAEAAVNAIYSRLVSSEDNDIRNHDFDNVHGVITSPKFHPTIG